MSNGALHAVVGIGVAAVNADVADVADPARAATAPDRATPLRSGAIGSRRELALAGAAAYDRCLRQPATMRTGAFALHVARHGTAVLSAPGDDVHASKGEAGDDRTAAPGPLWRLGLVIPKRYEPSAVARNTIKRRWRGAFRDGRLAWADEFGGADVVVRMHGPLVPKADRGAVPATVRARAAFDPVAAFAALAVRLRGRSSRSSRATPA